jgi:cysteine-rich repeat protein
MRLRPSLILGSGFALLLSVAAAGCGSNSLAPPGPDGGGTGDDGGAMLDDAGLACGNGIVDPGEQCDNGTNKHGSGCEPDCTFTCKDDTKCDDGDPCDGAEKCDLPKHTCTMGTPLADGASCGQGKACKMGVCGAASCGDGVVEMGEECDDGNVTDGDGCDHDCRFSCVSTDMTRNCTPKDPCQGQGTCDDAKHTCTAGTPLVDGTNCGPMNAYCSMGVCTMPVCGNGIVEPGESCDNGNKNGPGAGCELNCTFSCANPMTDCKMAAPACEKWSCDVNHACAAIADGTLDGKACGMNLVCKAGACIAQNAVCGNGVVEMGEDCDFGNANGPGTGCEMNCKFSCVKMPNSCALNPCTMPPTCATVMVNGHAGQACMPGAPLADGTSCGMNNLLCIKGNCQASMCGDGYVDKNLGETCEPPNANGCDAKCHNGPVCGNGVRDNGEQCDDGNTANLDGCNATCQFEQNQRVDYLKMQFATDMVCAKNALGAAIVNGIAQGQLQTSLDNGVADGSISILFAMLGITDLTGTAEPKAKIGVLNGTPQKPMGAPMYSGTADLDWWYTADPMSIDMMRVPTAALNGSIVAKALTAGPGSVSLLLNLGGNMPSALSMSNVVVNVTVGATSKPTVAMNNLPPGHVTAENLDPNLVSYGTTGQQNANGAGKLCGNVSALSLSKVPLPAAVIQNCNQYTAQNSILDLVVGGCTAFGIIQLVKSTQPDQTDPNAPVAGAGPPYTLSASKGKTIDTCTDKNKMAVPIATCEAAAAYSSYFKFTTDRVIINK